MNSTEVRLVNVCKSFYGQPVLRGVNLAVPKGSVIGIVGGSGCGKTVMLNHILGQLSPDEGEVWVANHEIPGAPLCDVYAIQAPELDLLHQHWGVVFQNNALFSGSVYDNIALWLSEVKHRLGDDIRAIARDVLARVGLPVDPAFLNQDAATLSGGMAKRLAIARALSMQPKVMFYDEPTSGLDPVSAGQIQTLIFDTHQGSEVGAEEHTALIITHDKDLLQRIRPRTIMLHDGAVFFDGPFEEFEASDSAVIRPYLEHMPVLHARPVPTTSR